MFNDVALGQYAKQGFTLETLNDRSVALKHQGEILRIFYQTASAPTSLLGECMFHMTMVRGNSNTQHPLATH